jgi:5-methylcytosine-specific restriction enzyme A
MNTYLLTWNPDPVKGWQWPEFSKVAAASTDGEIIEEPWSCANSHVQPGDEVYLMMVGRKDRGIIGIGRAKSKPELDTHWRKEKAAKGLKYQRIDCYWGRILNPNLDSPLLLESIRKNSVLAKFKSNWTPRSSGIRIPKDIAKELKSVWCAHVQTFRLADLDPNDELSHPEGEIYWRLRRHRRRENKLRDAKLEQAFQSGKSSLKCEVPNCDFDFHEVYGRVGYKFAHVHHLKPLGDRTIPSKTLLSDLVIVCANCHVMIHRGGNCRPLEGLISKKRKR